MIMHGSQWTTHEKTHWIEKKKLTKKKKKFSFDSIATNARYMSLGTLLILAASKPSRRKCIFILNISSLQRNFDEFCD